MFRLPALVVAATLLTAPAMAQDLGAPVLSTQGAGPAIGFTLRGGVAATPEYFGSDEREIGPALGAELNYLRLGNFTFGDPDPLYRQDGISFGGSFRYIPDRSADDSPELRGLDDVDAALELGGGLRYTTENFSTFGDIRYGVVGHEAFVGELGADVIARPTDRISLRAGPRVLFGDSDYASTYFGVDAAEEAASAAAGTGLTAFDASGGLLSTGVELGAAYKFDDNWGIDATLNYDRLQNDAASSPITRDDSQFTATIGITRRFTLGF